MNKRHKKIIFIVLIASMLVNTIGFGTNTKVARAAGAVMNATFEGDIHKYWGLYQDPNSARNFEFYRAYDAPFANGSYSAAIDASGTPGESFSAILSNQNSFGIDATKDYYLMFYAKATAETEIITYLQQSDNYSAITNYHARTIGNTWQRYMISLSPTVSSKSFLAFVVGSMPAESTLYLDGVKLIEANSLLVTKNIAGIVGESNKFLKINNIRNFNLEEIDIELPFYDNATRQASVTRIHPDRMRPDGIYFTMPERSFPGVAKVFVSDIYIGQFNYNLKTKVSSIHPNIIRLNQDVIISGSGFSPVENSTFLIVEKINDQNKREKVWLTPESFDSNLSELRFILPPGVVQGSLHIQSTFMSMDGKEIVNKSNQLAYKLKPMVVATNWSKRGYEHVGDKLRIYGLGFGRKPSVRYYDTEGVIRDTIKAKFIEAGDIEIIEVPTTKKINSFNITVVAGGVESDQSVDLAYLAKPVLTAVKTRHKRTILSDNTVIPAAKVGEEIILTGLSFNSNTETIEVEFQANGERIRTSAVADSVKGNSLKVIVPNSASNGYLKVIVNGSDSNHLPIEIVPTIISVNPNPVVPGEEIVINAYGIGTNVNLAKINFNIGQNEKTSVTPDSIVIDGDHVIVRARAPFDLSYNGTKVNLQYDRWDDKGDAVLNIRPHIVRAGINMDNKVLSIIGYGFSITPKENKITYKYVDEDQTTVEPNVRVLGVYPTEEGQEIRIKILDDYHFGNISVQVGEYSSNEVNFGPISVSSITRRVENIGEPGNMMGVLYIKGYNFGSDGGVLVGETWADIHYRSDFFIIAVVPEVNLYDGPVIIARE